jgi:hypothetical protein
MKRSKSQSKKIIAMKKLIVIAIAAFLPVFLSAQDTPLSSLYDRYVSDAGYNTTEILPGSMSFEWEATGDNTHIREMLKDIEKIRIVKYDAASGNADGEKLWKKIQKAAADDNYTEVVTVNADDVMVRVLMLKSPSGNTRELAMMEKDENGVMLLTVTGDMNFSEMFSPENMKSLKEMGEMFMDHKGGCSHD